MAFLSGDDPLIQMKQLTPEELKREARKLSLLAQQRNVDADAELQKLYGNKVKKESGFIS